MSDVSSAHRQCNACGLTGPFLSFEHVKEPLVAGGHTFPLMRPVKCPSCGHVGPPLDFPFVTPLPGPVARRRSWRKDAIDLAEAEEVLDDVEQYGTVSLDEVVS